MARRLKKQRTVGAVAGRDDTIEIYIAERDHSHTHLATLSLKEASDLARDLVATLGFLYRKRS